MWDAIAESNSRLGQLMMTRMMLMMLMMKHLFRFGYPDDAHDDAYDAYDVTLVSALVTG